MKIVYITLTGQTRKFVNKLDMETIELSLIDPFIEINEPFIIVAPTYEKEATEILWEFLDTGKINGIFKVWLVVEIVILMSYLFLLQKI